MEGGDGVDERAAGDGEELDDLRIRCRCRLLVGS